MAESSMDNNEHRSLQRTRMQFLYEKLQPLPGRKELKAKLKELPVSLRVNGLGTIGAQLAASSELKDQAIGALLAEWLLQASPVSPWRKSITQKSGKPLSSLLNKCIYANYLEYETAQTEALTLLEQAKLIAEALWPEE